MRNNEEHQNQVSLFHWAAVMSSKHPALSLMFAIPNGGHRHIAVATKLKAEGVKPGVPDIFLPWARSGSQWPHDKGAHGLFIELKSTKGKLSSAQIAWMRNLQSSGYQVEVSYEWPHAAGLIWGRVREFEMDNHPNPFKILAWILVFCTSACAATSPAARTGDADSGLKSCPSSPNCVSSIAPQGGHHIEPIAYTGDRQIVWNSLVKILKSFKRTRIVVQQNDYIHAEFASGLFGFVDDVEFVFPADAKVIQVRSASRTGYYDFGVNRRRIEDLRRRLAQATRDIR